MEASNLGEMAGGIRAGWPTEDSREHNYAFQELRIGTANVNSLFKPKNLKGGHISQKYNFNRSDISLSLKPEILSQITSKDIVFLTDTRLNKTDLSDLNKQVFSSHNIYSTSSGQKWGGHNLY